METDLLCGCGASSPTRAIDAHRHATKPSGTLPARASCPLENENGEAYPCHRHRYRHHHRRLRIAYSNDAIYERSQANIQRLLMLAATAIASPTPLGCSESTESSSEALARKALRYRKIYDRMHGVDVTDPRFDASHFLGITWYKLMP